MRSIAAKQEAFEESIKLKNQFRTLDEDEVEFLDSVLESTRAQENAVKKETMEQLEVFYRQRQEADKAFLTQGDPGSGDAGRPGAGSPPEEEKWETTGRKRRRVRDKDAPGAKLRKGSSNDTRTKANNFELESKLNEPESKSTEKPSTAVKPALQSNKNVDNRTSGDSIEAEKLKEGKPTTTPGSSVLGLGAYSSEED